MATRSLVEVAALKAELEKTDYKDLKARFIELGIESAWKNGVKKEAVIKLGLQALETQELSELKIEATESSPEPEETVEEETLEDGEYEIDEEALTEYPQLTDLGISVGDTLVVIEGVWSKKEDEENSETVGIVSNLSIEEADKLIKDLNGGEEYNEDLNKDEDSDEDEEEKIDSFEETVRQREREVVDESNFTLEEIKENIDITEALIPQSIESTRIILLHKLEALQAAHARKLSAE